MFMCRWGGNRLKQGRTHFNLALVFILCGLWHGAAWTFIVWGGWHGIWLILERGAFGRLLTRAPAPVAQAYMLVCIMLGWVFFRANDLPHALHFLQALFGLNSPDPQGHPWQMDIHAEQWTALIIGAALSLMRVQPTIRSLPVKVVASGSALLLCAANLAGGTYNPFIYFHF